MESVLSLSEEFVKDGYRGKYISYGVGLINEVQLHLIVDYIDLMEFFSIYIEKPVFIEEEEDVVYSNIR